MATACELNVMICTQADETEINECVLPETHLIPEGYTRGPLLDTPVDYERMVLPEHAARLTALINPHPRDKHVEFFEGPHEYHVMGVKTCGSVTGVVHHFEYPFVHDDAIALMRRGKNWPRIELSHADPERLRNAVEMLNVARDKHDVEDDDVATGLAEAIDACAAADRDRAVLAMSVLRRLLRSPTHRHQRESSPPSSELRAAVGDAISALEFTDDEIKEHWARNATIKANEGTWMHLCCELYLNRDPIDETVPEMILFKRYLVDYLCPKRVRVYRTEWEVWLAELNLAGSIDYVGMKPNGHLVLVDWKRTKQLEASLERGPFTKHMKAPLDHMLDTKIYHYKLQLNLYKYILETGYGFKVDEMQVVSFHPDTLERETPGPFVYEVEEMPGEVSALIDKHIAIHADAIATAASLRSAVSDQQFE